MKNPVSARVGTVECRRTIVFSASLQSSLNPNIPSALQIPKGVSCGAVPAVPAAQVPAAPPLHLLQLALPEPAAEAAAPPPRRHLRLQRRRLLHQVRRDHRHLLRRRRVSQSVRKRQKGINNERDTAALPALNSTVDGWSERVIGLDI